MYSISRHGKFDLDDISCVLDVMMTVLIYEGKICMQCLSDREYL